MSRPNNVCPIPNPSMTLITKAASCVLGIFSENEMWMLVCVLTTLLAKAGKTQLFRK